MSHRKLLAALAAITAALALAVPLASASAATTAPALPTVAVAPPPPICVLLQQQIRFATQTGNTLLANLLSRVFVLMRCSGPATG
jgi:ABC-type sugar transport system substrate-binding protein